MCIGVCTEIYVIRYVGIFFFLLVAANVPSQSDCGPLPTAAEFHPLNFVIHHLISQLTSLYVTQVHKRLQQNHVAIFFCFFTVSVTFLWVKHSGKSF